MVLEHSLGLGQKPNVVPHGIAEVNGDHRVVEIGWHPVGGFGGKWFAEKTGLGKKITETVHKYPDPTQHWAVLVGDFAHELWMVCFRCCGLLKCSSRAKTSRTNTSMSSTLTKRSTAKNGTPSQWGKHASTTKPSDKPVRFPFPEIPLHPFIFSSLNIFKANTSSLFPTKRRNGNPQHAQRAPRLQHH